MRKIIRCIILLLLILPVLVVAQTFEDAEPFWPQVLGYFNLYIGWHLLAFFCISVGSVVSLVFVCRAYRRKTGVLLIISGYLIFLSWYFYPVLTYKGTYSVNIQGYTEIVRIDEYYRSYMENDRSSELKDPYSLKPFRRMLLVEYNSPLLKFVPVRLGCDKIYQYCFWDGFVAFKRCERADQTTRQQGRGQPVNLRIEEKTSTNPSPRNGIL